MHTYIDVTFYSVSEIVFRPSLNLLVLLFSFVGSVEWMMEMLLFHLLNSIRGVRRGQVTLEQAKKTVLAKLLIRTRAKEHKNC